VNTFNYKLTYSFLAALKGMEMALEGINGTAENLKSQYFNFISLFAELKEIGEKSN
jgi:hypothetical protein